MQLDLENAFSTLKGGSCPHISLSGIYAHEKKITALPRRFKTLHVENELYKET
jgi:hypothetical protein